jgi:hypothetical protein
MGSIGDSAITIWKSRSGAGVVRNWGCAVAASFDRSEIWVGEYGHGRDAVLGMVVGIRAWVLYSLRFALQRHVTKENLARQISAKPGALNQNMEVLRTVLAKAEPVWICDTETIRMQCPGNHLRY